MLREVARKGEYLAHKALQLRDPGVAGVEPRFGIAAFLHVVAMAAPDRARKPRGHILRKAQRLADLAKRAAGAIMDDGGGNARAVAAIARIDILHHLLAPLVLEIDVDRSEEHTSELQSLM